MSLKSVTEFHCAVRFNDIKTVIENGVAGSIDLTFEEDKVQSYVSVFFNGNNSALKNLLQTDELCILRIDPRVTEYPDLIVTDRGVTQEGVSFYHLANALPYLNFSVINDRHGWTDKKASLAENRLRSFQRCAQLLVPNVLPDHFITGIYVVSERVKAAVKALFTRELHIPVIVHPRLFFETPPMPTPPSTPLLPSVESDPELSLVSSIGSSGESDNEDDDDGVQHDALEDWDVTPPPVLSAERDEDDDDQVSWGEKTGRSKFDSELEEEKPKKPRKVGPRENE